MNWFDLLAAGIKPSDVFVIGINGGRIAAFEYRLALALGATVGIVESSGRSASEILPDADWWDVPTLARLPVDLMTFRAFLQTGGGAFSEEQLEKMGRVIHDKFLEENRWKSNDPAMRPWEKLQDDLKQDNRRHAAYIVEILSQAGYGTRPGKGKVVLPEFRDKEVEFMAEMEHGRWNVQRLRTGWKYGPKRDPERKISPFLRPWEELTDEVRKWDRNAIRNYAKVLAHVGMEVYRKKD